PTQVRIESASAKISGPEFTISGRATVEDAIGTNAMDNLRVELQDLRESPNARDLPWARSAGLKLESTSGQLHLTNLFADPDIRMILAPLEVPDVSFLNDFLPAAMGLSLTTGSVTLMGDFNLKGHTHVAGVFDMGVTNLLARFQDADYGGALDLHAPIEDVDISERLLVLTNTLISLHDVHVPGEARRADQPWAAAFEFPGAAVK